MMEAVLEFIRTDIVPAFLMTQHRLPNFRVVATTDEVILSTDDLRVLRVPRPTNAYLEATPVATVAHDLIDRFREVERNRNRTLDIPKTPPDHEFELWHDGHKLGEFHQLEINNHIYPAVRGARGIVEEWGIDGVTMRLYNFCDHTGGCSAVTGIDWDVWDGVMLPGGIVRNRKEAIIGRK